MDSAEGTPLAPRTFAITAALVVLAHTIIMLVHGAAHMRLNVGLSAWDSFYVLCIVGIGPIAGLLLSRSGWQCAGATILFAAMTGALLFGLWKHFIAPGPDHVMHLKTGPWRVPFQVTAVLLAVSEAAGAVVAFMLLQSLPRGVLSQPVRRGVNCSIACEKRLAWCCASA